jgi:formate hydrogenlyase transcriptional activator
MQLVAHTPRQSSIDDGPLFERLLATLSSKLAALHLDDLAQALPTALTEICVALNVDRSTVIEFGEESERRGCYSAVRPGAGAGLGDVDPDEWRWLTRRLLDRHTVVISRLEDLPMEAQGEREYGRRSGLSATLAVPVSIGDRSTCALVLGSVQRFRDWQGAIQHRARLLAEIVGSALQRARQEAALRSSLAEIQRLNSRLTADNVCLKEDIKTFHDFDEIVGESAVMRDALERLAQVAPLNCSVLLLGETGTGKELFARAVHERSRRRSRALVRVNCAALPPSLIESELFGHEKGAFTGAFNLRQGRFELADGGTIFLDEIGDLPLDMQGKLLRVLQEGEFERVGSSRTRKVDVRIIAATHHDLEAGIANGTFRADLYYRLSVFPIHVPALRERREDIASLTWFFIHHHQRELGRRITKIPAQVMTALAQHDWPGNVRELENAIERALIRSSGDTVQLDMPVADKPRAGKPAATQGTLDEVQRAHIELVLSQCGWRINGRANAAERLGLHPNTLRFRMKKLGITSRRAQAASAGSFDAGLDEGPVFDATRPGATDGLLIRSDVRPEYEPC